MSAGGAGVGAWRPMHRELSPITVEALQEVRARGHETTPVHLALVTDEKPQRFRTACDGLTLGQLITGASDQVTCPGCLETVHA